MAIYQLMKAGRREEALAIYRWFRPLLDLDVSTYLVQNIKLAEVLRHRHQRPRAHAAPAADGRAPRDGREDRQGRAGDAAGTAEAFGGEGGLVSRRSRGEDGGSQMRGSVDVSGRFRKGGRPHPPFGHLLPVNGRRIRHRHRRRRHRRHLRGGVSRRGRVQGHRHRPHRRLRGDEFGQCRRPSPSPTCCRSPTRA